MRKHLIAAFLFLAVFNLPGQQEPQSDPGSFAVYDLYIDAVVAPAAWQAEFYYNRGGTKIVGIEGGEGVFSEPADYDSAGLSGGHIILASYSLSENVQQKRIKVCRLHVYETSSSLAGTELNLIVAADKEGKEISSEIKLVKVEE